MGCGLLRVVVLAVGGWLLFQPAAAQTTERGSVSSRSVQGNGGGSTAPAISADGVVAAARFPVQTWLELSVSPGGSGSVSGEGIYDIGTLRTVIAAPAIGHAFSHWTEGDTIVSTSASYTFSLSAYRFLVANFTAGGARTERVNINSNGNEAQGSGDYLSSISADGRFVAFHSWAPDLVDFDSNGQRDVFVHDRHTGATELVSVTTGGEQGVRTSVDPAISSDGRYVAFASYATNLVSGDSNGVADIFVHDRQTGITKRVSVDSSGSEADDTNALPAISGDGRHVAFSSSATNLVSGDSNGWNDIFVHDRQTGTTTRVSVDSSGSEGNLSSYDPSISADGRFVAFHSLASNLAASDFDNQRDIFVHDRLTGATEHVSVATGAAVSNGESRDASISADGRFVAFQSRATNLVSNDTNGCSDVFVRDRQAGTTERVSVATGAAESNGESRNPSISADGRYVAFWSDATNLVSGDNNLAQDVFVRDRQTGVTTRVSVDSNGMEAANGNSLLPAISANGRFVAFRSFAANLVANDTNDHIDVFVRDRFNKYGGFDWLGHPGGGRPGPDTLVPLVSGNWQAPSSSQTKATVSGHLHVPPSFVGGDLDGNGVADAVVDYGKKGLWARLNKTKWTRLTTLSPKRMRVVDLDKNGKDDVVATFEGLGTLIRYNENPTWVKPWPLHTEMLAERGFE